MRKIVTGVAIVLAVLPWGPGAGAGSTRPTAPRSWPPAAEWSLTWKSPLSPEGFSAISCAAADQCVAAGFNYAGTPITATTSSGGASWSIHRGITVVGHSLDAIACPSPHFCLGFGYGSGEKIASTGIATSTDGGVTWNPQPGPTLWGAIVSVACPSTANCVAVGNIPRGFSSSPVAYSTSDGGASWSGLTLPAGVPDLYGIACPSVSACVAVGGSSAIVTSDGGSSWTTGTLPTGIDSLGKVACPSASFCIAVGNDPSGGPVIVATNDGGATWMAQSAPANTLYTNIVACSSPTACIAGGSPVISTIDAGAHWNIDSGANIGGGADISCPSSGDCFLAGGSEPAQIMSTSDAGATWVSDPFVDASRVVQNVSEPAGLTCVSSGQCWEIGAASLSGLLLTSTSGGKSWSSVTDLSQPTDIASITALSCASSTQCWVAGFYQTLPPPDIGQPARFPVIYSTKDGGLTWMPGNLPSYTQGSMEGISCATVNWCLAVADEGADSVAWISTDGTSWSQVGDLGVTLSSGSVSCPAENHCWVAGITGYQGVIEKTTDGGAAWTSETVPVSNGASGGTLPLQSISCSDTSHCWIVAGEVFNRVVSEPQPGTTQLLATSDGGAIWSFVNVPPWVPPLSYIDCRQASTCLAVGGDANEAYAVQFPSSPVEYSKQSSVAIASSSDGSGYWTADSLGNVIPHGDAPVPVQLGSWQAAPVVGMAATPDGQGYWLVASDGGVFTFGDAGFFGSVGGMHLDAPIVGMTATSDGNGYWLVASDGGVFSFGDAGFFGSVGGIHLDAPIVGVAATPDGKGYWLVASDGGVFTFGDAPFTGSGVQSGVPAPVVAMVAPPGHTSYLGGGQYRLVYSNGAVYAPILCRAGTCLGNVAVNPPVPSAPITGAASVPGGSYIWEVDSQGNVYAASTAVVCKPCGG